MPVKTATSPSGNVTTYDYDEKKDELQKVTAPDGTVTAYDTYYGSLKEIHTVSTDVDGLPGSVVTTYEKGRLAEIDAYGNMVSVNKRFYVIFNKDTI